MPELRVEQVPLPLKTDVLLILIAVAPGPRHGYAIIRDVAERSDGTVLLQSGALYRTIRGMVRQGLLEESAAPGDAPTSDARRRYYRTTALGDHVLAAETDRLATLVRAARMGLAGRRARLA